MHGLILWREVEATERFSCHYCGGFLRDMPASFTVGNMDRVSRVCKSCGNYSIGIAKVVA